MLNRVWKKYRCKNPICDSELIKKITLPKTGIIVIEGPSGCGKTDLIKQAAKLFCNMERVGDYRVLVGMDGFSTSTNFPIFHLDNADIMGGMVATEQYIGENLKALAQSRRVIVSGIELSKRTPTLLETLGDYEYYRFAGEQK
jgi:uridine kinase